MFYPLSKENTASSGLRGNSVCLVDGRGGLVLVLKEDEIQDVMHARQVLYQLSYQYNLSPQGQGLAFVLFCLFCFVLFLDLFLFFVYECFTCMSLCAPSACWVLSKVIKGQLSP